MSKECNRFAPVVLFAYNRPWHLQQTVEALQRNEEAAQTDLFIYSDGPKNERSVEPVEQVRRYARTVSGFKTVSVVERPRNHGLSRSIIDGVTAVCNEFGRVIVLEDDLITSRYFLKFMNDGLRCYESEDRVASIHGYFYPVDGQLPPTFFMRGADCLGWATWQRSWALFEADGAKLLAELVEGGLTERFDVNGSYPYTQMLRDQIAGRNDSWAVRWHASSFLRNKLTLNPGRSLVRHIGSDGSGTNCGVNDMLDTEIGSQPVTVGGIEVAENNEAFFALAAFFAAHKASLVRRALRSIRSAVRRWSG